MKSTCNCSEKYQTIHHSSPIGTPLIVLAGQPNVGKSTIFNLLTGLNQHVGNWPGKTVEKKEGSFKYKEKEYNLVDLPGTYSLTANSPEELITREFILTKKPDLVVAMVNAANLERSLYLVAELITLSAPMIVVLNMMDVAEQEGLKIEAHVLEAALGIPVLSLSATHISSTKLLLESIAGMTSNDIEQKSRIPEIRSDHQQVLERIQTFIHCHVPIIYPETWVALKLLEGDAEIMQIMERSLPPEKWNQVHEVLRDHEDALLAIASGRYEWIQRMTRAAVTRPQLGQVSLTDRIDRWAAHPVIGLVMLALILGLVFWLTFSIGSPIQEWLDSIISQFGEIVRGWLSNTPSWVMNLVVDGIIGGAGSVLTFLPILVIFFTTFGFLEDVGYMARAAFVMDNFMHWMGLHGKSFLPIFLGFGCNVPSVIGTRVIDSHKSRLLTILVAPFVPCSARMAVVAFIAPAFFGKAAFWVTCGLIFLSLFLLVLSGVILNRILFKGERSVFIMEMPLYHIPNWRTIGLLVWQRSLSFIQKAGTLILAISVVIWVLSTLPNGNVETSILAQIGHVIEPAGKIMGMDWKLTVALLTSFLAKENSIASLGVLFGSISETSLTTALAQVYSPATALAFLTVSLLFIPCVATIAVIKQETGSWKWTFLNILIMLSVSFGMGTIVYQLSNMIMS